MKGSNKGPGVTDTGLGDAKAALDASSFKLLLDEIKYDEQCLEVYLQKVENYGVRLLHQRDAWTKKRLERAKEAVNDWWDAKVSRQLSA